MKVTTPTTRRAVKLIIAVAVSIVVIGLLSFLLRDSPLINAVALLGTVISIVLLIYIVIYFRMLIKEWFK